MTPKALTLKLNELVRAASPDSTLRGLEMVTASFGLLLDAYALPNDYNSEGMCDSKEFFRKYFAARLQVIPDEPQRIATPRPSAKKAGRK